MSLINSIVKGSGNPILVLIERIFFAICAAVLLFIAVENAGKWYLTLVPNIHSAHIEGSFLHIDRFIVENIVSESLQTDFFNLDIRNLEARLEQIEWVSQVNVRRVWPGSLQVHINEHRAVARWNNNALMSTSGQIFRPAQINLFKLPVFYAKPGRVREILAIYYYASQQLKPLQLKVRALYEDERQTLRILLNNGFVLMLGRNKHEERLRRFVQSYYSIVQDFPQQTVCVDFRYTHGFVVNEEAAQCYRGSS